MYLKLLIYEDLIFIYILQKISYFLMRYEGHVLTKLEINLGLYDVLITKDFNYFII